MDGFRQDIRYAWRQVARSPGFSAVVAATLALGIGATTAVFSVVEGVLLAPLSYYEPGQLVRVYQQEPGNPASRYYLTGPHFREVRDHAASFEHIAALNTYSETGLDLVKDGQAQRVRVLEVTSEYFQTLGPGSLHGPGFAAADETGTRRVVLSDALWRTRFASDPAVIGTIVHLSAEPYEVAGIAAAGIDDPIVDGVDVWVPYNLAANTMEENYSLTVVGRLRNGITLEQARAELAALSVTMKSRWPAANRSAVVASPLRDDLVAAARGPLQLLLLAVGLVLLVACVNVANLMLVRATGRVSEFAIRTALGSGRSRILRQLLAEGALLAGAGGLLGVALAWFGIRTLQILGGDAIPRLEEIGFDPVVVGFAAVVTAAALVVFSVAPLRSLARIAPVEALRQQSRSATGTRGQGRLRTTLAAAQLALALALLMGAGVLVASFHRLQQVSLGFRVEDVLTFDVNLPTARYSAEQRGAFQEELSRRLEAIPGVTAAGGTSRLPATGSYHPWATRILSGPLAGTMVSRSLGVNMQNRTVSGHVFRALDIPLVAGRVFDERETAASPMRAIVSASFARQAFPGIPLDAVIGQRIATLGRPREIIGVVGDVTLDVYGASSAVVYHSHRQFAANRNWALSQVVAAELPPERILADARAAVASLDPELVVHRAAPLADVVGRSLSRQRFALVLMSAFAAASLLLAALGLYGMLAFTVRQRTREIGIRIALGASAGQIRALVFRQAAAVLAAGLVVGAAASLALGRWLSALVYQTSPWDPRVLAVTAVVLTATGVLAALLAARRASRVEPTIAMHEG
jgi:predicted permease